MVAPAAASEIFQFFVISKKKAYNGLKKYKSNSQYSFVCLGIRENSQIYLIMS